MYDYVCIPGHFFQLITVLAWIYDRSDFLCSRELENAHSCLDGRVFTLFSQENTLIILASKCTSWKNAKRGESCLQGFSAWHRDHCSTYSIDVVSKCSYGHSSCFSWSNVLHSNQAAAQQQEAVGSMIPNIHGKRKTCSKPPTSYRMAPPSYKLVYKPL